ncbi:hypothetical protein BASA81_009240 [Batrachochytrium salamandrivorans]|nr:hypothetical protein BASA81_009240 [Batrachochytrium salamandrivorans]
MLLLRSQFYHGLSSEIKDALVHFDNPSSVSAAMDMAIRIDNRLFERRQEQRFSHQRPSSNYSFGNSVTIALGISSSTQDSLNPDNLQFQVLESLQVPQISRPSLVFRNKTIPASDSAVDPPVDASLFKDPSMDLDLGIKKPVLQVSKGASKSVSFAETIQAEVYPFLEASPVSTTPIPSEIDKEFSSVFSESQANILPSHRSFDCTINLSSSAEPSYGRIYQLTREEDKVMQEWIAENLAKGFIRNSSSPYGAPCFFVKQKDKLRLCMDYRGLNKQTVKDRNPIPLISEMLRTLSTGKIFTTLDLRGAYNLLRIKEGDESKTAFITKYGQFEFLVMPFGLANAPAQFPTNDELAVSSYDQ